MTDILIVDQVNKSFGALKAVASVSFSVPEQAIYGIAGPNGAGKTTLFNTISGIPFGPDSGQIHFAGQALQTMKPHHIVRLGVARTFQKETVFHSLTVLENVLLGAVYGGNGTSKPEAAALETLELVGLADKAHQSAENLSLFDEKRLMFATALVTKPKLLLLDEPAAGLNQVEIQETIKLVRTINEQGLTILLIEHVLPLLLAVSQQIMILNHGAKLTEGSPKTVISDERVIEAYLGKRGKHDKQAT